MAPFQFRRRVGKARFHVVLASGLDCGIFRRKYTSTGVYIEEWPLWTVVDRPWRRFP
jgi:hypothetical protein